ncbi:unnamed protein product, partial [Ectocarpus sp. 12 AP-2014]
MVGGHWFGWKVQSRGKPFGFQGFATLQASQWTQSHGDVVLALICGVKAFDRDTHPLCKLFLAYLPQNTRHGAQMNG